MDVCESRKVYESINGTLEFQCWKLLLRNSDGEWFTAQSASNLELAFNAQLDELEDLRRVPPLPSCPPGVTVAPSSLASADDTYTKKPDLLRLAATNDLHVSLLEEIRVCELVKRNPHQNIAEYRGCLLSNGQVTGLCFKRYQESLMTKVNPNHLNKSMFVQEPKGMSSRRQMARYLPGIQAGLRHLHALGIVHNDLNPMNVMIDQDDNPVIIDFDSCRVVGATLQDVKRTYGWHDQDVGISLERNDTDAMEEIRVFLTGTSPEDFLFSV